jgi:hypothetical protein
MCFHSEHLKIKWSKKTGKSEKRTMSITIRSSGHHGEKQVVELLHLSHILGLISLELKTLQSFSRAKIIARVLLAFG